MTFVIEHQPDEQRFIANIAGEMALLEYELNEKQGHVDFYRTYVPNSLRGRGIAEKLVRKGLSWAREKSYKVDATCWYVKKFLN